MAKVDNVGINRFAALHDKLKPITDTFKNIPKFQTNAPDFADLYTPIDQRSRVERREDLEKALAGIDKEALRELIEWAEKPGFSDHNSKEENIKEFLDKRSKMALALTKFDRYIKDFERLNSEEERRLTYKEKEHRLESLADWKEKFRTFLFRVLGSMLLIATLFSIGYIEKNYEWATLPLTQYFKPGLK